MPWVLIKIDAGAAIPATSDEFSGLCFMGGPMSVNDNLPWIEPVCTLIRHAVAADVPVIGHCLGGQLMSKALGGRVTKNPVKELGWGKVSRGGMKCPAWGTPPEAWLSDLDSFEAFHWHGETFSIPPGAQRLLASQWCENQAFVMGPHLGMQCHVEMTEAMVRLWCRQWADECAQASASVQSPEQMFDRMGERLAAMRVAADRLYTRWIAGLSP
jgi:GMP synthase-like glutamine amidotransferase